MTGTTLHRTESASVSRTKRFTVAPAIRVLHVINGEHYAGAERVQDHLALRLPEHGFEVSFACLKPDRFDHSRQSRESPLYDLPMRSRLDLRPVRPLTRLIRQEGFALIHTHSPRTALVGSLAAAWCRVPFVHHVHTQTHVEVGGRWMSRFGAVVERRSLSLAAGLISVSGSISQYLRDHGYAQHHIWLVPNGVPATAELPPWHEPLGAWTLGVLALFRPRKGLEVVLRALSKLHGAGVPVRLRAVGCFESPAYEKSIRELAEELGVAERIDWQGFCLDIGGQLRQMDIFILPSLLSEGMPMSVLEAMSAGTPVVATRVDGVTDVIRDGEDGLLAAPGDANDLAQVLAAIIRGEVDCDGMRENAHRRQTELFSDHSMAAGVAKVYKELICR
jgi:glycosyltransferase involved in cell wall biosynthesis